MEQNRNTMAASTPMRAHAAKTIKAGGSDGTRTDAAQVPRESAKGRGNLYQEVTARIIADLEAGIVPWVQPWTASWCAPRFTGQLAGWVKRSGA